MPLVTLRTPEGGVTQVDSSEVSAYLDAGFSVETGGEANQRVAEGAAEEQFGGAGGALAASAYGLARGASLGLSDVILRSGGADAAALRGIRETNRGVSLGTEILGGIAPTIVSGGVATPAGLASRGALGLGEAIGGAGASTGRYIAGTTVAGAAEGALQNVGSYISDVALENKELSAEGFLGSAGQGALWGGVAGGALAGVERGTIAARRLFPRSQAGGKDALQIAESTFRAQTDDAVKAADDLQSVAESAAKDLRIRQRELALEREKLRGAKDGASRIRVKEIALEQEQLRALRKAERDATNAKRAARGEPDLPAEPTPQVPTLDPVAPPTGPPTVTPSLAGADDLEARLAATQGLLDEGVPFADIGAAARAGDALAIAAKNTAHEADMLADDAARSGADAADRLEAKLGDFVEAKEQYKALIDPERKGKVADYIAQLKAKAGPQKYKYVNSIDGTPIRGGAGRKTDRVRSSFDDGLDEQGSVYDRVWAGIGNDVDPPTAPGAGAAPRNVSISSRERNVANATEVTKKMTGGRSLEDITSLYAPPPGYSVNFHATGGIGSADGVILRGTIRDSAGNDIGKVERNIVRDKETGELVAKHGLIEVDDAHRGKGISDEITRNSLRGYRDLGVKRVELDASWLGRYQWLRNGWRPTDPEKLVDNFVSWAKKQPKLADRIDEVKAAAEEALTRPGGFADLDIDGLRFDTKPMTRQQDGATINVTRGGEYAAGKSFLLSDDAKFFSASLPIDPADPFYQHAAKRLKFDESPAGTAPRRAGADLDAEYDDLVARAANADGPDDLAKIAKQAGDVEDEIFKRVEARGGTDAEQVAKIRANREKYGWSSSDVAARRAEKLAVAEPGPRPLSGKMAAEQADIAAFERTMRQNQFGSGKTAGELAREMTTPAKRSIADDILASPRVADTAPGIEVVDRTAGRFVDDAAEAVQIVGNMERATYDLATELGPAAPPAMQKFAADYAAAIDDQSRKMTEAMAMKADDVAKSTALMTLPKPPAAPPGMLAGKGGKALDAMAMLDTANEFAQVIPGMPNARDIPVVGPLLSMYLKFRAIKSLRGGLGGRIAATGEAKVAARSAELRDKVAGIVDDLLMASSKGAKVARKPVVVGGVKLMDSLKFSLFPDGEEKKEQKTPAEALKARVKELSAAAANPDAVRAAVRQQVGATNPDVAVAIESAVLRKLGYLQKHAPKAPPPGPFGAKPWNPSNAEMERFARRIRAAEDPASVLEDFERGTLTPEAAETLRVVYPAMFAEVQTRLLTRAAELEANLPYQKVLQASLLFDVPLDASLRPENLRRLQSVHASQAATGSTAPGQTAGQPPAPPAPSVAGPVNVARLYETADMRRATRR